MLLLYSWLIYDCTNKTKGRILRAIDICHAKAKLLLMHVFNLDLPWDPLQDLKVKNRVIIMLVIIQNPVFIAILIIVCKVQGF